MTAYFERITNDFRRALEHARRSGELDDDADIEALASFLTTALVGVAASIRAEAPAELVQDAARVAPSVLDAHPVPRTQPAPGA